LAKTNFLFAPNSMGCQAIVLAAFTAIFMPIVYAKDGCLKDLYSCPNGVSVKRDPENNCKFFPCRNAMETTHGLTDANKTDPATNSSNLIPVTEKSTVTYDWKPMDTKNVPSKLRVAVWQSFDRYKNPHICDRLQANVMTAEFAITKKSSSEDEFLYQLFVNISCTLKGVEQASDDGLFLLQIASDNKGMSLMECARDNNGTITNWLAIEQMPNKKTKKMPNKKTVALCQTPDDRASFLAQPITHVVHDSAPSQVSSVIASVSKFFDEADKTTVISIAAAGVVSLTVLVIAMTTRRRPRRETCERRSVLEDSASSARSSHGLTADGLTDDPTPKNNALDSAIAVKENDLTNESDDEELDVALSVKV
jgi:hypothetical protein